MAIWVATRSTSSHVEGALPVSYTHLYTFFTHVLEAAVPAKVANNPYALQPDVWPKAIIILLEICLIVNIIQIIKKNKGNPEFTLGAFVGRCV